jgi:hypothetical protein
MRNAHPEQVSSAMPPNSDIARRGQHFAFVLMPEVSENLIASEAPASATARLMKRVAIVFSQNE